MPEHPEAPLRYGTIGAGAIGQAIANHLVNAGHEVVLSNRRGPSSLEPVVSRLGPLASAGTVQEAAWADMVFLTVMWPDIATALRGLPPWGNRVLGETTNQFDYADGRLQPGDPVKAFGIATATQAGRCL